MAFHFKSSVCQTETVTYHVINGSIRSECLRISKPTLLFYYFLPRSKALFERMTTQGGVKGRLLAQIQRAIQRHPEPFYKFAKTPQQIIFIITGN